MFVFTSSRFSLCVILYKTSPLEPLFISKNRHTIIEETHHDHL